MTMERDSLVARLERVRHKKRGSEYEVLGIGKMQAADWRIPGWNDAWQTETFSTRADMSDVTIYRSLDDGSLWVRPREEFEDGRFERLETAALSRPEQVVIPTSERPESDALLPCPFCGKPPTYAPQDPSWDGDAWSELKCTNAACDVDVEVRIYADRGHKSAAIAAWNSRASAPASPTIGIQAVKALADRVRALLLVDQPASWEERRKIADELESLSALHPAPEAASAGAALQPVAVKHWPFEERPGPFADRLYAALAQFPSVLSAIRHVLIEEPPILSREYLAEALPNTSDTAPSPKGVSDGVREAFESVDDEDWRRLFLMLPDSGYGSFWKQVLSEIRAALSQEPVPATAEERAASKEGA